MADKTYNTTSEKLLITGITGYIGFQTLTTALKRGHHVRGVVRKERNVRELQEKSPLLRKAHEQNQLEFVVIPDYLASGAIESALEGITAIVHLASPLAIESNDYDATIVKPAIAMVTTVLEAAAKVPSVRRVVITSSCVTLVPFEWNMNPDSETLYTADHTNTHTTGPFHTAMEAYWASKALARTASRDFISHHKPPFDIVNLLPSVVIGPDERLLPSRDPPSSLLQGTRAAVMAPALTEALNSAFPYVGVPVHVADVARAHIDAATTTTTTTIGNGTVIPGNTEYILSSETPDGVEWDRDIRNIARKAFAAEVDGGEFPLSGSLATIKWRLDGMTTEKVFGWKFRSFERTMEELMAQYLELKRNE